MFLRRFVSISVFLTSAVLRGASPPDPPAVVAEAPGLLRRHVEPTPAYLLGSGDELAIHVSEMREVSARTFRIDPSGMLHLPVIGNIRAGGLPIEELEASLVQRLQKILLQPEVSITVVTFQSQPVSVLGAVNQPGIRQLQGPNRLLEAIAMAGGPRQDAGNKIRITRRMEWGPLPMASATVDGSGKVSAAEVSLDDLTSGRRPETDIYLRPHDVISINSAELIYVLGEVNKVGGFTLAAREQLTVLQALALAGGLQRTASPKNASILRKGAEPSQRAEIRVDIRKMLDGKAPDVTLRPDDVLFIPNNFPRTVALRAAEAAIQVATGLVIWRR